MTSVSIGVAVRAATAVAVDAAEGVSPGVLGFLATFALALACWGLFRSLTGHLRRLSATKDPAAPDAAAQDPAAQDVAAPEAGSAADGAPAAGPVSHQPAPQQPAPDPEPSAGSQPPARQDRP